MSLKSNNPKIVILEEIKNIKMNKNKFMYVLTRHSVVEIEKKI